MKLRSDLIVVMLFASITTAIAQGEDFSYGRRLFIEKAQCSYCHGWAGDGSGEGQSNGGAANLRKTKLNRAQLITTIQCGRPSTAMPHFDESAYSDRRCYGLTELELGSQTPSLPLGSTLQMREIETIADYILSKFVGRGTVTRDECEESFGKSARVCTEYAAKP